MLKTIKHNPNDPNQIFTHNVIASIMVDRKRNKACVRINHKNMEYRIFDQAGREEFNEKVLQDLPDDWMASSTLDVPHEFTDDEVFIEMVKDMFHRN